MKNLSVGIFRGALLLAALLGAFSAQAADAPAAATASTEPAKAPAPEPTLYIISDSTAAQNSGNGIVGWGRPLADYFDPAKVRIANKAIAARSSRSFMAENHWDPIVAQIKPGDIVLLQFGHNDTGTPNPNPRGDRPSLPGLGEETVDLTANGQPVTVHTYGWYMRKYIADAKAKGAQVVVLSVTVRDIWTNPNATFGTDLDKTAVIATKTDKYNAADDKVERGLDDGHGHNYADEAREIAKAQSVPFVDLTNLNADQYEKIGREKAAEMFKTQKVDHTHSNAAGADFNAASIVAGLKALKNSPYTALLSEKGKSVPTAEAKYVADNATPEKPADAKPAVSTGK